MTPKELRRLIQKLPENLPRFKMIEQKLEEGSGFGSAWYSSQKQHWDGWLTEYDGPGAYGRKIQSGRDARFIYNHIQCAPMLFWLAEALEISNDLLDEAEQAIMAAAPRNASKCAAFRSKIPWKIIEAELAAVSADETRGRWFERFFCA